RGIGAAIAMRLAAEGAAVIVNYSASPARAEKVVKEIRDAGGKAEDDSTEVGTNYQYRFRLRRGCTPSRCDDVYRNQICGSRVYTRTLTRAGRYRNYSQWLAAWRYRY